MLVYALCRDRNERAGRRPHPRDRAREAAERRAAARPARQRLPPRLRRARPDPRGLRGGRPLDRRARGRGARPGDGRTGGRGSSTATSTSAARPLPACACRRRRSARTAACRSPTAGPADPERRSGCRSGPVRRFAAEGALVARRVPLRRHVPARPRRARRRHAVRVPRAAVRRSRCWSLGAVRDRHRCVDTATIVGCSVRVGIVAGVLLFGGYATQTVGLQYTSPSTSAFITGLYVMFTPLIEAVVRRAWPPQRVLVVGIVVATIGLYLLTGADLGLGRGELLTLACAFLFAVWIVYQGGYAARLHPIPFTTMQMVTLVVRGAPGDGAPGRRPPDRRRRGSPSCSPASRARPSRCRSSSGASAGSRRTRAALILLMEPVFAAIAGYVDGERLGAVEVVGAVVILGRDRSSPSWDRGSAGAAFDRRANRPHCRGEFENRSRRPPAGSVHARWIEQRCFELLGGWVTSTPEPDVKLVFARQSHHHAWHAELFDRVLPSANGFTADGLRDRAECRVDRAGRRPRRAHRRRSDRLVGAYDVLMPATLGRVRALARDRRSRPGRAVAPLAWLRDRRRGRRPRRRARRAGRLGTAVRRRTAQSS